MATDYLINLKDADVMQMVYEQDVDLGFNWQHLNSPVKNLKSIDGISTLKNASYNGAENNYFIDGETGEQVPVDGQISSRDTQQLNRITDNQQFNFEENVGYLDNIPHTLQSPKTNIQGNTVLWQQSGSFSDLSTNTERLTNLPQTPATKSTTLNSRYVNPTLPNHADNGCLNPQITSYTSSTYEYRGSSNLNVSPQKSKIYQSTPQYSPMYSSTSSVLSAVMNSDEGMSMDVSIASPVKQDQSFPYEQYKNYNFGGRMHSTSPPSIEKRNPSLTSLQEPGQSFFDFSSKPESSEFAPDVSPIYNSVTSYTKNMNAPCLNPHFAPYPPPPLQSSPPYSTVNYEASDRLLNTSLHKNGEHYESDSGISLDHSPKGYNYLSSYGNDDIFSSNRDFQSNNQMQRFQLQEVKSYSLNSSSSSLETSKRFERNKKTEKQTLLRESRDEKKARELNLPFTLDEIILTPVEDYNEMLARTHLNSAQLVLIKDIRRRGKNKVAAQNCRKRKIETITIMEEDVDMLRLRKQQLVDAQKDLEHRHQNMKMQYESLYHMVFNSLRDNAGHPYDPKHFRLEQVDGNVMVVPQSSLNNRKNFFSSSDLRTPSVDFSKIKIESF